MKKHIIKATKVSDDIAGNWDYPGEYYEKDGTIAHGIYETGNNQWKEKVYINNGNLMASYLYPSINTVFSSSYINNFNLHLCGGWHWRQNNGELMNIEEMMIERIAKGLKPLGFLNSFNKDTLLDYQHRASDMGLATNLSENPRLWELGISNVGKLEAIFDFSKLISDYNDYIGIIGSQDEAIAIEKHLESIRSSELSDYIMGYDYSSTDRDDRDSITTGLILGYSIETTVSICWADVIDHLSRESGYSRTFIDLA